jgi:DNA-binding MarR family transcriptional regulator
MKPAPLLLMLDALLSLIEQQLQPDPDDPTADLRRIGDQIHRLIAVQRRLAETASSRPSAISAATVRAMLKARRLRIRQFGSGFANNGWTLLLTLYAARLERRRLSIAGLRGEAALRRSSTNSRVHHLHGRGLLTFDADPADRRAALIGLTDETAARMENYLQEALRLSPLAP